MVSYTMLCVPVSSSSLCASDDYHTPSRNYNDSDSPLICCQYQIRIVRNNKHHTHKRYIWCSWCTQTKHCCNSTAEQQTQTCTSHTPLPISAIAWVCMCAACIRIVHVCSNILYVFYAGKWRYYKPHGLLSISAFQFVCTSLSAKKKTTTFSPIFSRCAIYCVIWKVRKKSYKYFYTKNHGKSHATRDTAGENMSSQWKVNIRVCGQHCQCIALAYIVFFVRRLFESCHDNDAQLTWNLWWWTVAHSLHGRK